MADTHIATVVKDIVTSLGVVVGGGWALWKWGFSEHLRRKREIPALDGEISTTSVATPSENELVTLNVAWTNHGPYPVRIDPTETRIDIYELDEGANCGPIVFPEERKPEYTSRPYMGFIAVVVSPKTTKKIQEHFVLNGNKRYLIVATVVLHQRQLGTDQDLKGFLWYKRELIWPYPKQEEGSAPSGKANNDDSPPGKT